MNQEHKQLVQLGPYKTDFISAGVYTIRGQGQAAVAKCSMGVYNRKDLTIITTLQAEIHAKLVLEAFQVLALSGKSPMELWVELKKGK